MSKKYPGGLITAGAPAGYSIFFPGSGSSYVVMTNASAAINPSTSTTPFTVECWVYTGGTAATTLFAVLASENYGFTIGFGSGVGTYDSTATPWFGNYTGGWNGIRSTTAVTLNRWTHIACVFTGSTCYIYQNGVMTASGGPSTWGVTGSSKVRIGCRPDATTDVFNGYIAGARVVIGSNLYPGGTTFTPPTLPLNVTNTQLLVCTAPNIIDQSANAFPLTVAGTAAVSTFTPFTSSDVFYNSATRLMVPSNAGGFNPAYGAAAPGVWTLDQAQYNAANRLWPIYDPQFNRTTLMLNGNYTGSVDNTGTPVYQNNAFLDSSSNNFLITRNGNTTQGTFTPFSQTGWGNYFDGSSVLSNTTTASTGFNLSTGSFTIEAWVYVTAVTAYQYVINLANAAGNDSGLVFGLDNTGKPYIGNGVVAGKAGSTSISANSWNHVAVVSDGTNIQFYTNGTANGSAQAFNPNTAQYFYVGRGAAGGNVLTGYISNVRVTKGGALYTSAFTPSTTPLTTTVSAGTVSLLTCQSNRFIDNSTNAFAITLTGTPSIQAFSPFYPTQAYNPLTVGGSGYFDGTGDWLRVPYSTNWEDLGTGDFEISCWFYLNNLSGDRTLLIAASVWTTTMAFAMEVRTTKALHFWAGDGAPISINGGTVETNCWNYAVASRVSGTTRLFLNGTQIGTPHTGSVNITDNEDLGIGAFFVGNVASANFVNGYITGVRIRKGSGVTSVTVPTTPPTAITNTQLLLNFTNGGIIDATGKNVLETVGNAQISTAQSKWGGSSMYFDGTGDWLIGPASSIYSFGTGDFTVEVWVYPTTLTAATDYNIIDFRPNNTSTSGFRIGINGTTIPFVAAVGGILNGSYTFTTNNWYHFAVTRSNGVLTIWINGTSAGSNTTTTNFTESSLRIGVRGDGSAPYFGYMDDLRITKGFARYTTTFVPPTSQLQQQ